MKQVNCLIADDEPIARDIILKYCSHLPNLQVVATCSNALEAKAALQQHEVDIMFLDINMPVLDGVSFLKTLRFPPQVIFTTAYKEYAVNAFDLSAVDYLLKPFSLERFIVAVDKALERLEPTSSVVDISVADTKPGDFLFVKTDSKIYRILHNQIIYAEASGNYIRIFTKDQTYMPNMTFTALEQQLPRSTFIRVHRSFIINKNLITHIEGNRVFVDKREVPIGSNYKDGFMKELGL